MTIKNKESMFSRLTRRGDRQMKQIISKKLLITATTRFNPRDNRNKNPDQVSKENN